MYKLILKKKRDVWLKCAPQGMAKSTQSSTATFVTLQTSDIWRILMWQSGCKFEVKFFCHSLTFISTCPPPACRCKRFLSLFFSLQVSLLAKLRHSLHLPRQLLLLCVLLWCWRKPLHLLQHKAQTLFEFLHPCLILLALSLSQELLRAQMKCSCDQTESQQNPGPSRRRHCRRSVSAGCAKQVWHV